MSDEFAPFMKQLEEMLIGLPGVNVQLPPHQQRPFRSENVDVPGTYEAFDRKTIINPIVGYRVPEGHRAVIVAWALGVNFTEQEATWTDPTYQVYFTLNGSRMDVTSRQGRLAMTSAVSYRPQSENLVILANDTSAPIGSGTIAAGIGENPFGLSRVHPTYIPLAEGDILRMVYNGEEGLAGTAVNLYARILGWSWPQQEQAEGDIGV